jgi:hypothetical protein
MPQCGDPLEDERHLGGIEQLLTGLILDLDAFGPCLHRPPLHARAFFGHIYVVVLLCHLVGHPVLLILV